MMARLALFLGAAMIGWVPYSLSAFLDEVAGTTLRREIVEEAGFDPDMQFRIDKSYSDALCRRILDVACERLAVTEEQAFELFAPFFLKRSREMFPGFFSRRPTVRSFLLHQPEVHNTLAAGLDIGERGHVCAKFRVEEVPGGARVFYRSVNRLAGLYAAVAKQLGKEFGEPTNVTFEAGGPKDPECVMIVHIAEAVRGIAA